MISRALLSMILLLARTGFSDAAALAGGKPRIESGFNLLYQLNFGEARRQFSAYQQENPADPLGYVAMAAGYLFEEFYCQHVLTSEFFLDDDRLLGGIRGKPDEVRKRNFEAANLKGRELALQRLKMDPHDAGALSALTMATGMQADFAAILMRRHSESLSLIKETEGYAERLLVLRPDEVDAWLYLGAANYIIGSLPAYKRLFLWFGGIHGDKRLGMVQMRITAGKGHYLKPFAEILLAMAALRENQKDIARSNLGDLVAQFPENLLFRAELFRLNTQIESTKHGGQ